MNGSIMPSVAAATTCPPRSASSIEQWLSEYVARSAGLAEQDVDVAQPFSHYALDSVATVELTADLEDWLGLRLPPTLLWDYPTIAALARHLHGSQVTGR